MLSKHFVELFEGSREARVAEANAAQKAKLDEVAAGYEETASSGLRYKILEKGDGQLKRQKERECLCITKGSCSTERCLTHLTNERNRSTSTLGVGQVIKGWDEGIQLLKVGDKARMVIPSDLAYGSAGAGGVIPGDATIDLST